METPQPKQPLSKRSSTLPCAASPAAMTIKTALEDISELSEQFIQDIGTTTEQFTKLTAATTANGISVDETAEVYRGLAAANLALGR